MDSVIRTGIGKKWEGGWGGSGFSRSRGCALFRFLHSAEQTKMKKEFREKPVIAL